MWSTYNRPYWEEVWNFCGAEEARPISLWGIAARFRDKTILIVGAGVIGEHLLNQLAWAGDAARLVLAGRDIDKVRRVVGTARLSAYNMGRFPVVEPKWLDIVDLDSIRQLLDDIRPDLVVNCASLQAYWVTSLLPANVYRSLHKAGIGPWIPMHLAPTYNLARVLADFDGACHFVNAAYPDAVNPALASVGMAPLVGIGNLNNYVPSVVAEVADRYGVDPHAVRVRFVAHHYASYYLAATGSSNGAEYLLWIEVDGSALSDMHVAEIVDAVPKRQVRLHAVQGSALTGSSAFAVVQALLQDTATSLHTPGPLGLPGGYPVTVSGEGVAVDLPNTVPLAEALAVNEQGQWFDGVGGVAPGGRVSMTDDAAHILRAHLGYAWEPFEVPDVWDVAGELGDAYQKFAADQSTGGIR